MATSHKRCKRHFSFKGKCLKSLGLYLGLALCVIIATVFVYGLYEKDLGVPLLYQGDALGALIEAQNTLMGNSTYHYPNLSAPYGGIQYTGMRSYFLHLLILKLLVFFTQNASLAINLFFILTFVLAAWTTMFVLKKLGISTFFAISGAMIYAFMPYHLFRGTGHLWLAAYYIVPLMAYVIILLLTDEMELGRIQNVKFAGMKELFHNKSFLLACGVCLGMGLSDLYYSAFSCMLLLCVGICASCKYRKKRYLLVSVLFISLIGMGAVIAISPTLLYGMQNRLPSYFAGRNAAGVDVFGLRISQLLVPIAGHRISLLNDVFALYKQSFHIIGENYMASLGAVMSIGFCLSLFGVFVPQTVEKINSKVTQLGLCNLFLILVASIGGLSSFIAIFISASIRCYNRVSVFIGIFSLISLLLFIQHYFEKIYHRKRKKSYVGAMILTFLITVLAILDQTPSAIKDYAVFNPEQNCFEGAYTAQETKIGRAHV